MTKPRSTYVTAGEFEVHVTEWGEHVERAAAPLLASQVKSWQTGVNRNVPGRDVLRVLGYNGSAVKYRKRTEREVAEGFPGFLAD